MKIEYLVDYADRLETLAGWHHGEWSHLNPGDTLEKRVIRVREHLGRRQIPTTFIALDGETLLGSACLLADDMHQFRDLTPWLASVFVAPERRSRGAGSAVVERVVEEARSLGVRTLYLYTPDRESFYARTGWIVHERTEYLGIDVVIMQLSLADRKFVCHGRIGRANELERTARSGAGSFQANSTAC